MSSRSCGAFAYTPARRRSAPSYSAINRRKISLHRSSGCAAVSIAFKQVVCLYPKTLRVVFGGVEPAGSRVNQFLEHRPKSLSKPCIVDVIRRLHSKSLPQDSRSVGGRRFEREESALRPQWDEPWASLCLVKDKAGASITRWKHLCARGKFVALGLCDAVLADLIQQRLVADLQQRGSLLAVPIGFVESFADGLSFGSVLGSASQRL